MKPIAKDIDIRATTVSFSGFVSGSKVTSENDVLRVLTKKESGGMTVGALHMTRLQWQEFRNYCDGILDAHAYQFGTRNAPDK